MATWLEKSPTGGDNITYESSASAPPSHPSRQACARPALATTSRSWPCNKDLKEFLVHGRGCCLVANLASCSLRALLLLSHCPFPLTSHQARHEARGQGGKGRRARVSHALSPIPRRGPPLAMCRNIQSARRNSLLFIRPGGGTLASVRSFVHLASRQAPSLVPGMRSQFRPKALLFGRPSFPRLGSDRGLTEPDSALCSRLAL
jgi:hypothetical protein